ncbi:MAG: Gfo/Idh/MocA family oxidoreductase [Armatimonadetes bacterium]|nr:Gfo/Idh/MocA family oxidoreductase [Armatimonadota bacterium]
MRRLKYGIIGLGWFGEKHLEALSAVPQVELHSLCTRRPDRLAEIAAAFGVSRTFTDYHQMLADPELEAVSIVTMWDQHAAPTLAALAAGKHVFLEKPMASTNEDCRQIVAAAEAAKTKFMVGHICRFNPRYAAAKQEIQAGAVGDIVGMYSRRNLSRWIGDQVLDKIGPIIGDGVHDTDLMLWMSGAKVVSAYAQTVKTTEHVNPDLGWTMYRFDSGAVGVVETIWYMPEKIPFQIDERLEVVGTKGSVHIHDTHPNFSVCDENGWRSPDTTYWPELHGMRSGALREELAYFASKVLADEPIEVIAPRESAAAVEACLAAEESARTGQVVYL